MATKAQIAANRKNAKKSTGPKTPEGRAAVRLNGLKHGLTSQILVLPGESISDFEHLLDSLEAEHQPTTPTEVILVRQMAMASWRLNRILHMEASHYHIRRSDLEDNFEEYYTNLTEPDRHAIIAADDKTLINFARYEAQMERSFHRNLTALHRLRAQRKSEMTKQSQSKEIPTPVAQAANGNAGPARPAAPPVPTPIRVLTTNKPAPPATSPPT